MYLPSHFREERADVLRGLMTRHPLAALVTTGTEGIEANHIPLLYQPGPAPLGTLRGHLSRANNQWRNYSGDVDALAIFQGPDAYITPNAYPTKQKTGRAVPTWNYAVVHVYGRLTVYSDPVKLRAFLDDLTATHEADRPEPWKPSDAPPEYVEGLLKAIVGIELSVTRIDGKWKVSQNQPSENRTGAAEWLDARDPEMARLIRHHGA